MSTNTTDPMLYAPYQKVDDQVPPQGYNTLDGGEVAKIENDVKNGHWCYGLFIWASFILSFIAAGGYVFQMVRGERPWEVSLGMVITFFNLYLWWTAISAKNDFSYKKQNIVCWFMLISVLASGAFCLTLIILLGFVGALAVMFIFPMGFLVPLLLYWAATDIRAKLKRREELLGIGSASVA